MNSQNQQLVVLDFPGIKNYVFGTDRLVEIRGASALLDNLNREKVPNLIKSRFKADSQRIFAGGGAGQFIINDEKKSVENALREAHRLVYKESGGGLRLMYGISSYRKGSYQTALQQAFLDLENNRYNASFDPVITLHSGFIRECVSCGGMASDIQPPFGGSTHILCEECGKKEMMGKKSGLWKAFSKSFTDEEFDSEKIKKLRPNDFKAIGERCLAKHGYTALVYGDGNDMGRLVKQIDSPARFETFSNIVKKALSEACHEALKKHCRQVKNKIPADILLLGGDDLMIYMSAETAMPFAIDIAERFEAKTQKGLDDVFFKKALNNQGLTLSLGIAYGRSHTPISIMVDQAEELLKTAKQKGTKIGEENTPPPACIDFHLTSRFNQVNIENCRNQHLLTKTSAGERLRLYQGPYTLDEARILLDHGKRLRESNIPSGRLHRLGEAPFLGKINGTIETLTLYGRCRSNDQKKAIWDALSEFDCLPLMPWYQNKNENETSTVLPDLIQMTEFIRHQKKGDTHAASNPS